MILRTLSDDELLLQHENSDPLTRSELQDELAKRFSEAMGFKGVVDELEEAGVDTEDLGPVKKALELIDEYSAFDIAKLLGTLTAFDIDTPEALRQALQKSDDVGAVWDDITEPLERLRQLCNPAATGNQQGAN